jgi:cbb3-type cytochrome oxidase maturation protein
VLAVSSDRFVRDGEAGRNAGSGAFDTMTASIVYTFGIALLIGLMVMFMFIWGVKTGAFEQSEDAKYILFRDDDD